MAVKCSYVTIALPSYLFRNSKIRGRWSTKIPVVRLRVSGDPSMQLLFAKKMRECPQCDSSLVRRSARRGLLERVFYPILFVWPYRCDDCDVRFLGFHRRYAPI